MTRRTVAKLILVAAALVVLLGPYAFLPARIALQCDELLVGFSAFVIGSSWAISELLFDN